MIGDRRVPDAPPVDSLAECVVLRHLELHPNLIGQVSLDGLLTFAEHRELWRLLVHTYMRGPYAAERSANVALFGLAFDRELCRAHPDNWRHYRDLLCSGDDLAAYRADEEYQAARDRDPDGFDVRLSSHHHGFEWWLARLQRIADARALISSAREIAERAWREDVEGAREVAGIAGVATDVKPLARSLALVDELDL